MSTLPLTGAVIVSRPMNACELTELIKKRAIAAGKNRPALKVQSASEVTAQVRKEAAYKLPTEYNTANKNQGEFFTSYVAAQAFRAGTTASGSKINTGAVRCEPLPNIPVTRAIVNSQPIRGYTNDVRCRIPSNVTPRAGVRTLPGQVPGGLVPSCNSGLRPQQL